MSLLSRHPSYKVRLAETEQDLLAAQRLRYDVFVTELGGDGPMIDHANRLERDRFDPFYDHLLLIDTDRDPEGLDHVVGVYRLLTSERAEELGEFYTDGEYDLAPLRASGRRLLELGRSCVAAAHRGGTGMFHLWNGLGEYVAERHIEILFGVASFHGTDVAALAQPLSLLHHNHLAPEDLRVTARDGVSMDLLPPEQIDRLAAMRQVPALVKAYLRLGGFVGSGAYVDREFNTTDVCLLVDTARMSTRHRDFYSRGRGA
ncbi:ornithine-acyl-ACP acyltransferase [Brevirhabdus pacifica]|uniref:L-ornithine N(alpha)-acyltransferase n=1 Tax=Brevirhabdus pacifica TaxID=1267768 RepID=A0A1U7DF09_9RHOB|nr:GNAT family N-acyltransferase [Brevirhabdus pacifica]APX88546.1 ornithine-acyl-ACP acyltransferase [Brevirhabdus pacifica]OWU79841.1 ornithine-acyl-ACP acyltransferase [Loktanella sp. 22II-4b]PJJ86968.1 ornithine-acyl[acyl carrier protein] N-acyltransferase [Brevirhabdus pacifica]